MSNVATNRVDAFRNAIAILHNLEASELSSLTAEQRMVFFRDPRRTLRAGAVEAAGTLQGTRAGCGYSAEDGGA